MWGLRLLVSRSHINRTLAARADKDDTPHNPTPSQGSEGFKKTHQNTPDGELQRWYTTPRWEAFEIPGLQARPYHDDELQAARDFPGEVLQLPDAGEVTNNPSNI